MTKLVVDLSDAADIAEGRRILDAMAGRDTPPSLEPPATPDAAERLIERLMPRLGTGLQTPLRTMASKAEGSIYTIPGLARELNIPPQSLRSKMNGPLMRSYKAVVRDEVPDAPPLFDYKKRGNHWELSLTPTVREAILEYKG